MTTFQELFARLTELDPEFDQYQSDITAQIFARITKLDLRVKLENHSDGWLAIVSSADGLIACQVDDKRPRGALLSAYAGFLEKLKTGVAA